MKRIGLLAVLMCLTAVVVWAGGQNFKGYTLVTNTSDTLNDTASGSGLAEISAIVYGLDMSKYKNIYGKVIIEASPTTTHDYGSSDSAIIWFLHELMDERITIDSTAFGAVPCTLVVDSEAVNWGSNFLVKVAIIDTLSDTNITAKHKVKWDITVRE